MVKKIQQKIYIHTVPQANEPRWKCNIVNANAQDITWDTNIPQDVRDYCVRKINAARQERAQVWQNDIVQINMPHGKRERILEAVGRGIRTNNRFIPEPFDKQVLIETLSKHNDDTQPHRSFMQNYVDNLRKKVLLFFFNNDKKKLDNARAVWVRIPSLRHDKDNFYENVSKLEILSSRNWCTKSKVDKAQDALVDGDFFVYLEKDSKDLWQPLIGMTSYQGRIDQIQGKANNNIIPTLQLDKVVQFINEKKLQCSSGVYDEGPKAFQQILISERLKSHIPGIKKTFEKAIKANDAYSIFRYLWVPVKHRENKMLEIGTYRPILNLDRKKGVLVPYNMFGIQEDKLLENVEKIDGDMILYNSNPVYASALSKMPEKLKKVTGTINCSQSFFEKQPEKVLSVVDSPSQILINNSMKVILKEKKKQK